MNKLPVMREPLSYAILSRKVLSKELYTAKITVLFGHPPDPAAFEEYRLNHHLPLVEKLPGLQRVEAAWVVGTPDGSDPPYYMIAELFFESMERMQESLATPEGEAASADVANLATGGTTIFISEVAG